MRTSPSRLRSQLLTKTICVLSVLVGVQGARTARAMEACSVHSPVESLCVAKIVDLHPTQMSVGMLEVAVKADKVREMGDAKRERYLKKNPKPTVIGPGGTLFIIDHHHLSRALYEIGVISSYCQIVENASNMTTEEFWTLMKERRWVYTYDENGVGPHAVEVLPRTVAALKDDPYRSLAGVVRKRGGFEKDEAPFAEFAWANFFRPRVSIETVRTDFEEAVRQALELAKSPEAQVLPGWVPPPDGRPWTGARSLFDMHRGKGLVTLLWQTPARITGANNLAFDLVD